MTAIRPSFFVYLTVFGFRHVMRDRLRAVNCPSEMIDQIGGWSSGKVGEGYGEGYSLEAMRSHLNGVCGVGRQVKINANRCMV